MENTPRTARLHIGIFGRCNSGKSSLVNALTGREAAVVSELAGTTTDPVATNMELPGLGAVVLLDTAGFDDTGELGAKRLAATRRAEHKTDIAVVVFTAGEWSEEEALWAARFRNRGVPVVAVLNPRGLRSNVEATAQAIGMRSGLETLVVNALTGEGKEKLFEALAEAGRSLPGELSVTGGLAKPGDVVLLVMPQDSGAPHRRLILPQSQTLRELLDKGCIPVCCTPGEMERALSALSAPPRLVITDSQVFTEVGRLTPPESLLTSFSVLFARLKGDLRQFIDGAKVIDSLDERSRVLIAEACAHAPAEEDIGRVKIPDMLRKKAGAGVTIDFVAGDDFPDDLTPYDLVIHCGACMFNRRHVLSRIARAAEQHVPVTNYGIAIAQLTGILGRVAFPDSE